MTERAGADHGQSELEPLQRFFDVPPRLAARAGAEGIEHLAVDGAVEILRDSGTRGWTVDDVQVTSSGRVVRLPERLSELPQRWIQTHPGERSDRKVSLSHVTPTSPHRVSLSVDETKWSEVQPLHAAVSELPPLDLRSHLLEWLRLRPATLPNIACVHGVIRTSDRKIVVVQRHRTVRYHPLHWSVSFEEQLDPADLVFGPGSFHAAAARGVNEEFLATGDTKPGMCRLLAVILEHEILNPAVVAYARLPHSAADLRRQWQLHHTHAGDQEAENLDFVPLDVDSLARLTLSRHRTDGAAAGPWHPTSRYRLLVVMLNEFGEARTSAALASAART